MIHLFYDVISSLVVVMSCFLVNFFNINWLDALSGFIVALLILMNTIPLFYKSL